MELGCLQYPVREEEGIFLKNRLGIGYGHNRRVVTDALAARNLFGSAPLLRRQALVRRAAARETVADFATHLTLLAREGLPRGASMRDEHTIFGSLQFGAGQCYVTYSGG